MGRSRLLIISMLLCAIVSDARSATVEYNVIDLHPPGAISSAARAINDSGQVAGYYVDGANVSRAFRYSAGTFAVPAVGASEAYAINNAGVIVGTNGAPNNSGSIGLPFAYDGMQATTLNFPGNPLPGIPLGINGAGKISLTMIHPGNQRLAYVYDQGNWQPMGTLGGSQSVAGKINSAGHAVGAGFTPSNQRRAFLFNGVEPIDLGAGNGTEAIAINDFGVAVGDLFSSNTFSGIKIASGQTTFLTSVTFPHEINNAGIIVGEYSTQVLPLRAVMVRDGTTFNLNNLIDPASGWNLQQAFGINESNQIVGVGRFNGQQRAFLLTPVPEPCSASAVIVSLLLMTARRTQRSGCATSCTCAQRSIIR